MIPFAGRGILLDVEGTTSSVAYVFEVLFPYARRELATFLRAQWDESETLQARECMARDAGAETFATWIGTREDAKEFLCMEVLRLTDRDAKTPGLKQLQGLIWREGYLSGELKSHVYEDVPAALAAWQKAGIDVRIFSSGSVAAQRLFFSHTVSGDLSAFFRGHYDTTLGPKREAGSYKTITADMGLTPRDVLFLSDTVQELDAARSIGCATGLALRPGNAPVPPGHGHPTLSSLAEVELARPGSAR